MAVNETNDLAFPFKLFEYKSFCELKQTQKN